MRKNLLIAALAVLSIFMSAPAAQAAVSECHYDKTYDNPGTIYVARDGSGTFNCDGVDDQIEINQAFQLLKSSSGVYTSVFLKSGTYTIGQPVSMVGRAVLEGDQDAILKLRDQANWKVNVPMIGAADAGVGNLEIKCFEVDVNYGGNFSQDAYSCMAGGKTCAKDDYACCESYSNYRTTGKGYYNVAGFSYGSNYLLHDMYLHDGLGDGLNVQHVTNVKFYDNRVYKMGHEGLYVKFSDTAEAYGNAITTRTNSALRADDTNHVSYHDNDIQAFDNWSAGGPGIEIVKDNRVVSVMNDIEIYNNVIRGTYGPGIWITASGTYGPGDTAAHIHHNIFSAAGINPSINWTAGILTSGFYDLRIENNVFDKVYNGALIVSNAVAAAPAASGYMTTFRNNIVTGTQPQRGTTANGYGILNLLAGTHTVNSENNCFYQNAKGDYAGAVSVSGDIFADPLFADAANGDYHLKSQAGRWDGGRWVQDTVTSPCIDAGSAAADFSLEPDYNGGRINIGRYGNTKEASKTVFVAPVFLLGITGGTGSGSYALGEQIPIQADAPALGKVFDKWSGDIMYISDSNASATTVNMPAQSVSLTANYIDANYGLNVTGGTGSGSYLYGQSITITANAPAIGKVFDKWTGDIAGVANIAVAATTVVMPSRSVALTATYKDVPVATYSLSVTGGVGGGKYVLGDKVTISANAPAAGKVFDRWIGDTAYLSSATAASATVTMPGRAIALTASYKTAPHYTLKVSSGKGSGSYYAGYKVSIVANAAPVGKVFGKWIGDTAYVSSTTAATATVTMPGKAISLSATYVYKAR